MTPGSRSEFPAPAGTKSDAPEFADAADRQLRRGSVGRRALLAGGGLFAAGAAGASAFASVAATPASAATDTATTTNGELTLGMQVWYPPSGDTTGGTDTPAIQGYLSAGMSVYLLPGATYYVNKTLEFPPYIVIDGGNPAAYNPAKLQAVDGSDLDAVLASQGWPESSNTTSQGGVVIRNLQLDCNSSGQTAGAGHGIVTQNWSSRFEHITIRNANGDALRLDFFGANGTTGITNSMVENRITDVNVISCGGIGINTTDPSSTTAITDGIIERCIIDSPGVSGIVLSASAGWLVSGCHLYGLPIPQSGIACQRPFMTRVIGNYVESFGGSATPGYYSGISCGNAQGLQGAVIAGNMVMIEHAPGNSGSTLRAIDFETGSGQSAGCTITGNLVHCSQPSGGKFIGILIQNDSSSSTTDAVTTGNNILGTWTNTLYLNINGGTINHSAGT